MEISDEQYEEMEIRINQLSAILGMMLRGMTLVIPRKDITHYCDEGYCMKVAYNKDNDRIVVWTEKLE